MENVYPKELGQEPVLLMDFEEMPVHALVQLQVQFMVMTQDTYYNVISTYLITHWKLTYQDLTA